MNLKSVTKLRNGNTAIYFFVILINSCLVVLEKPDQQRPTYLYQLNRL